MDTILLAIALLQHVAHISLVPLTLSTPPSLSHLFFAVFFFNCSFVVGAGEPQILTARSLQEIITKLSIDDHSKGHEFWDTQPVPKLSESSSE